MHKTLHKRAWGKVKKIEIKIRTSKSTYMYPSTNVPEHFLKKHLSHVFSYLTQFFKIEILGQLPLIYVTIYINPYALQERKAGFSDIPPSATITIFFQIIKNWKS